MKNPSFKNGIAISLVAIVLVSLGFFTDTIDDNQVTGNFVGVTGMVTAEELDTSINTIKGKTEADMHVSLSGDNLFIAYSTVYKKFYYYSFEKNDWYTRPNSIPSAEFNALPVVKTANQDGWSDGATLLARISDLVPETAQPETAQPETEPEPTQITLPGGISFDMVDGTVTTSATGDVPSPDPSSTSRTTQPAGDYQVVTLGNTVLYAYAKQEDGSYLVVPISDNKDAETSIPVSAAAMALLGDPNKLTVSGEDIGGYIKYTDKNIETIKKIEGTTTTYTTLLNEIGAKSIIINKDGKVNSQTFVSSSGQSVALGLTWDLPTGDENSVVKIIDAMVNNGETSDDLNNIVKVDDTYKIGETTYTLNGEIVSAKTGDSIITYDYSKIEPGEPFRTIPLDSGTYLSYDTSGKPVQIKNNDFITTLNSDGSIKGITTVNGIILTKTEDGNYEYNGKTYDSSGRLIIDGKAGAEDPTIKAAIEQAENLHDTAMEQIRQEYEDNMWLYGNREGTGEKRSGFERFQKRLDSAYKGALGGRALSNLLGMKDSEWRKAADEFFLNNVAGQILSGNWEESICHEHIDRDTESSFYVRTPDGLIDIGASISAERSEAIQDPETGSTEYLYKLSYSVRNPSLLDSVSFKVRLEGDSNWLSPSINVGAGDTESATGSNMKVRYSPNMYSRVCLIFDEEVTTAVGNSVEEVCNAVTTYTGSATTSADWDHGTASTSTSSSSTTTSDEEEDPWGF